MFIPIWFPSSSCCSFGFDLWVLVELLDYQKKSRFALETLNLSINLTDLINISPQSIQTIIHSTLHLIKLRIIVHHWIKIIACNIQWPMQFGCPMQMEKERNLNWSSKFVHKNVIHTNLEKSILNHYSPATQHSFLYQATFLFLFQSHSLFPLLSLLFKCFALYYFLLLSINVMNFHNF